MIDWILFAILGKVLVYLWMSIPIPKWRISFLNYLHNCDLCSGVWIYFFLSVVWDIDILHTWFYFPHHIVNFFVTGAITSFIVHVFSIGFREKFLHIVIS
jgi:hypothetical protein